VGISGDDLNLLGVLSGVTTASSRLTEALRNFPPKRAGGDLRLDED